MEANYFDAIIARDRRGEYAQTRALLAQQEERRAWMAGDDYQITPMTDERQAALDRLEQFGGVDAPSWWFPGCDE